MDITAEQVRASCPSTQGIEQQITIILKTFQSEILEAGKNGSTSVIVAVPTNFNVIGMNNKSAQTIIYHSLIEILESRDFDVRVSMNSSVVTYGIRWDIQKKCNDLEDMRNIIASHMVPSTRDTGDAARAKNTSIKNPGRSSKKKKR